jgi:hypothetical protein
MRKFFVGAFVVSMFLNGVVPAQATGEYVVQQKTLATFSSDATTLTPQQKAQVRAAVDSNPYAEKFICTGIRYYDQPISVNITVRKRAKAACEYAKQLNPALSTWFQNKPTKARSYAGKVLLTVKTSQETIDNPEISLETYDPEMISAMAAFQVQTYLDQQPNVESKIELRAAPGITDEQAKSEMDRLENIAKLWGNVYGKDTLAMFYTGSDLDWAIEQLHSLGNTHYDSLIKSSYALSSGTCVQSSGVDMDNEYPPYLIHCVRDSISVERTGHIGAHEYTHMPLGHFFNQDKGGVFSQGPAWVNEGGADFFGISTTISQSGATYEYWYDKHLASLRNVIAGQSNPASLRLKDWLRTISAEDLAAIYLELEQPGQFNTGPHMYALGFWATQLLVAVYGLDTYFEFMQSMNPAQTWQETFQEVYRTSLGEVYESLTPYVRWIATNYE